jgi:hypothetical protein
MNRITLSQACGGSHSIGNRLKLVRGTIHIAKGTFMGDFQHGRDHDRDFVGVKTLSDHDLWSAGHSAWAFGPYLVDRVIL